MDTGDGPKRSLHVRLSPAALKELERRATGAKLTRQAYLESLFSPKGTALLDAVVEADRLVTESIIGLNSAPDVEITHTGFAGSKGMDFKLSKPFAGPLLKPKDKKK